ncbi:MAG: cysteine desulfurase [Bacilli bacterium]|nr:cysteine desulfurase [Bacilli bacterium]
MNREDFPILSTGIIYFDNGATSMKPKCILDEVSEYYSKYTANAHRGDYDNSLIVDEKYEEVRTKTKKLINSKSDKEIVFTKGTTDSINLVANGFIKDILVENDEIIITKAEHASNILPWLRLAKEKNIIVKYIPLNENNEVTIENLLNTISEKTKVISLAHITNVIGDTRPIKEIGQICKDKGIYFIVDGAQSVPHIKADVQELNIDFLAFSAHKMLGPTGVGVLYGKEEYLEKINPQVLGGGMNSTFTSAGEVKYKSIPTALEAGTPNIEGVIAFGRAIDYLLEIGYEKINEYEKELSEYLREKLNLVRNIEIYNKEIEGSIVAFNIKGYFAQDTAVFLNKYKICVRAGNHCAKILEEEINVKNTCRISLYFYNTKEEIDKLIEVLNKQEEILDNIV